MKTRASFASDPADRDARGVIDCWVDSCSGARWVDAQSIVSRCGQCGDPSYEYDMPGGASEEFEQKAREFRERRAERAEAGE